MALAPSSIDIDDLIEAIDSPASDPVGAVFRTLFDRRFTGTLPLILHFRGGRVQVLEVLSSTQIRLQGTGRDRSAG